MSALHFIVWSDDYTIGYMCVASGGKHTHTIAGDAPDEAKECPECNAKLRASVQISLTEEEEAPTRRRRAAR